MVWSTRAPRRGPTRAWMAVGIAVTVLVLLVDASIKSRSPGVVKTLSSQAYIDRVLPLLNDTVSQGDEINQVRTRPVVSTNLNVLPTLQGVATNASATLKAAKALNPPASVAGPNGLLLTSLQTRVLGAQTMAAAAKSALDGGANPVGQFMKASQEFQVADQAYALFLQDMPAAGVKLPASAWLSNPDTFTTASLNEFVNALHNAASTNPVHDLQVQAISTVPPDVSVYHGQGQTIQILPMSDTVSVVATFGNIGNGAETNVPAYVSLTPGAPGYPSSWSQSVTLQQGQSTTVTFPPIHPLVGSDVWLTVSIGPVQGETNKDYTKSIEFYMESPNTAPTSTVPGTGSGTTGGLGSTGGTGTAGGGTGATSSTTVAGGGAAGAGAGTASTGTTGATGTDSGGTAGTGTAVGGTGA